MFRDIPVRRSRYAPHKLVSPAAQAVAWVPEGQDLQGNAAASLTCSGVVEVRVLRPVAGDRFQISLRSQLVDGEGTEWSIAVPAERFGLLYVPPGFAAEHSVLGTVYRLAVPRTVRVRVDQMLHLPGLQFTLQWVDGPEGSGQACNR